MCSTHWSGDSPAGWEEDPWAADIHTAASSCWSTRRSPEGAVAHEEPMAELGESVRGKEQRGKHLRTEHNHSLSPCTAQGWRVGAK